jgi:hypothetical protein
MYHGQTDPSPPVAPFHKSIQIPKGWHFLKFASHTLTAPAGILLRDPPVISPRFELEHIDALGTAAK